MVLFRHVVAPHNQVDQRILEQLGQCQCAVCRRAHCLSPLPVKRESTLAAFDKEDGNELCLNVARDRAKFVRSDNLSRGCG